jgi:2,3-diketo-5-methylthio-1-phosphopentane phosphatase
LKDFKLKIFCDFDGTVTQNDVWVNSLGKFIKDRKKFAEVCSQFSQCQITARECLLKELELVEDFSIDKFNLYLNDEKLDDYFNDFMEYCRINKYQIFILSEGLDFYIKFIFQKYNISLPFFSNKLKTSDNNGKIKLGCEFPYSDETCNWCGVSKRNIILTNTNEYDNEVSVFIGDGISDCCAANYSDIVFAKKELASYCWKNNITYFEYKNFSDIIKKIERLIEKKQIKQRQTAKINRRNVFWGG